MPSTESYETRVAGLVSPTPGIVLGEAGVGKVKVATTGRVKVRIGATFSVGGAPGRRIRAENDRRKAVPGTKPQIDDRVDLYVNEAGLLAESPAPSTMAVRNRSTASYFHATQNNGNLISHVHPTKCQQLAAEI